MGDMACEALHSLGEVSMEGHNYEQAITDFEDCLSKRIAVLPTGSRSIAETYYWHGVALAHVGNWTGAEAALNHALDVIDIRINTIEMMEPSEHMTQEKEDLEELMIAVVERIEDQKDMQKGTYVEEVVISGKVPICRLWRELSSMPRKPMLGLPALLKPSPVQTCMA